MQELRDKLTYANVMATVAVFVALGGGAYAAKVVAPKNSVTSKSVKNAALKGVDVKKESLTGDNIDEGTLVSVCPSGTTKAAGICFESAQRGGQGLDGAMTTCAQADRFLPTPGQLRTLHIKANVSVINEQTTDYGGTINNSSLGTDSGLSVSNDTGFARPFRCAFIPG